MAELSNTRQRNPTFSKGEGFHSTLKERVEEYFSAEGISRNGDWRLFAKIPIILSGLVLSYLYLVFVASTFLEAAVSSLVLSQCLALIGMDIMHDGNHESASKSKTVNRLLGFSLDLVGGSSYMWRQKHNILHHTYTNIDGYDEDLDSSGLLRLSPHQPWRPWHRYQAWFALPVYSLLTLTWLLYNDFAKFFSGRVGDRPIQRPRAVESGLFFATKVIFFLLALGLPSLYHPFSAVLLAFVAVQLMLGLTLAVVFQLAHTVGGNEFPAPDPESGRMSTDWGVHQVLTTADFGHKNSFLTWYVGGLNFQVEHHLFPRISHIHYPSLSPIVEKTCEEFEVPYHRFPSLTAALKAHFGHLSALGRPA